MNEHSDEAIKLEIVSTKSNVIGVVTQEVPKEKDEQFLEWQRGISAAALKFDGYQRTEVYPPVGRFRQWVAVVHFESNEKLELWLNSDIRKEWVDKLREEFGEFKLRKLTGLDAWFSQTDTGPPGWKMVLIVWLGLFPTVMFLNLAMTPFLKGLSFPENMFISNLASVSVLQYLVMPLLSGAMAFWLKPSIVIGIVQTIIGFAIVAILLSLSLFYFNATW